MAEKCNCGGFCEGQKLNLLYSCSGAANTGYLADAVTRKLMAENTGKMTCLTAIGADVSGFIESAKSADSNIIIDGCPVACGAKIFKNKDLPFEHFVITDFGVIKGKTEITEEVIEKTAASIIKELK